MNYKQTGHWNSVVNLTACSLGIGNKRKFVDQARSSVTFIRRLTLTDSLDFHDGCVNSLNFNTSGNLILSGSDDLKVAIWDWQLCPKKPQLTYDSGHGSNVFQTKFMPCTNDSTVVTCGRDGQIRVGFISSIGHLQQTKRVAQHKGSAHKLSVENGSPNLLKSAGEDAMVYQIDLREDKPTKLLTVQNAKNQRVPLYTIHNNPLKNEEFAVAGRDQWARIFDVRKIMQNDEKCCVKKFCPDHIQSITSFVPNVTCLMYNYAGTELLVSYNDEDIYLFDVTHSSESNHIKSYKGHRNSDTVKGVNFFGACSEYVVSGSDCGHVYMWDKQTEEIVVFLKGDDGVVNVLEPHPNSCILATAGLDHDVKIWQPCGGTFSAFDELNTQTKENAVARAEDSRNLMDPSDSLLIFRLISRLQHQRRRRILRDRERAEGNEGDEDDSSSDSDEYDIDLDDSSDTDDENEDGHSGDPACIQA